MNPAAEAPTSRDDVPHRKRVVMFTRNTVVHDSRVRREAASLVKQGYDVVVLGRLASRSGERETFDGVEVRWLPWGGGSLAALNLVLRASRAPHKVALAVAKRVGAPRTFQRWVVRPFGVISAMTARLLRPLRAAASAWRFQLALLDEVARIGPDVIHAHDFNTLWAGRTAGRRLGVPVVYDAHELYAHQNLAGRTARPHRRWFVEIVEAIAVRGVDAVITVNDSLAEHMSRRYRIERPAVVRNIPDRAAAADEVEVPAILREGGTTLLYLGGITRGRGIVPAIRALALLPEARFVALGPVVRPEYVAEFEAAAREARVSERVHILPPVPPSHVTTVASHATVALSLIENVCLSYYLSLPNKIFEALHAGLPVIASDFPEMRRIVDRYGVGRTCDPHDPAAIAGAVRDVLAGDHAGMKERAKAAAVHFTWEREADRLLEVYRRVAA